MERLANTLNSHLGEAIFHEEPYKINFFLFSLLVLGRLPRSYPCYFYYAILFRPVRLLLKVTYKRISKGEGRVEIDTSLHEILGNSIPIFRRNSERLKIGFLITNLAVIEHQLAFTRQLISTGVCDLTIFDAIEPSSSTINSTLIELFKDIRIIKWEETCFETGIELVVLQYPYLRFAKEFVNLEKTPTAVLGYGPHLVSSALYRGKLKTEFAFPLYHKISFICVHNKYEAKLFRKAGISKNRIIVTGDPLAWNSILSLKQKSSTSSTNTNHTFDFLWAPHHSKTGHFEDREGYSNFERDLSYFFDTFKYDERTLLIRPHSLTLRQIEDSGSTYALSIESRRIWSELTSFKNVTVSNSHFMIEDIKNASKIVTDGISIIAYAMLLEVPVILSKRPNHVGFKRHYEKNLYFYGQFISLDEFHSALKSTIDIKNHYSQAIKSLLINGIASPAEHLVRKLTQTKINLG